MIELWKDIPHFPDYAVSNLGRVKRLTPKQGTWIGKILKPRMNGQESGNYYFYSLPDSEGNYSGLAAGRLVAMAFIPNPDNKPEVNHIDGDKANNSVTNLEWATRQEQMEHAKASGLIAKGSEVGKGVLKEENIPFIRAMHATGRTIRQISGELGVSFSCIQNVLSGRTWGHI